MRDRDPTSERLFRRVNKSVFRSVSRRMAIEMRKRTRRGTASKIESRNWVLPMQGLRVT
jgi:predicted RNA-binding protein associated with RNAse of E/G family